ncbi:MAG: hypothetical protein ACRDON_10285 [Gaiellaceae bacterium]
MAFKQSLVAMVAVAFALAGGASVVKPGTAHASLVEGDIPQRPPVVNLRSESPWQRGVWGTFCVSVPPDDDGTGVTLCADFADDPEPRWLSVVRPGERIVIFLRKTTSASGAVFVYARGCEDRPARRSFEIRGQRTAWVVPRLWGSKTKRFELSLGFEFAMEDGRSGDAQAALGILVSKTRDRGLVRNRNGLDCGEPY